MPRLYFRDFGEMDQQPIVFLHGLFGSSKNWISICKSLSDKFRTLAFDFRNHGESFHSDNHSLMDLASDVIETLEFLQIQRPILVGHSMGGLVAMLLAIRKNDSIQKIIIEDIAPRNYPFTYQNEVEAMNLDVSDFRSRQEIDEAMKPIVPDMFIRQFLQMNLERKENGGYFWKINTQALANSDRMFSNLFTDEKISNVESLFLLGGNSDYVSPEDHQTILEIFPSAKLKRIEGAGHFLHHTHSEIFLKEVRDFLDELPVY